MSRGVRQPRTCEFEVQSDLYQALKTRLPEGFLVRGEARIGRKKVDLCIFKAQPSDQGKYQPVLMIEVKASARFGSQTRLLEQMESYHRGAPRVPFCAVGGHHGMNLFLGEMDRWLPAVADRKPSDGILPNELRLTYGKKAKGLTREAVVEWLAASTEKQAATEGDRKVLSRYSRGGKRSRGKARPGSLPSMPARWQAELA